MIEEKPCNRCATEYTLRGRSKRQAMRDEDVVPSDWHDEGDCIRHLAAVIGLLYTTPSPEILRR